MRKIISQSKLLVFDYDGVLANSNQQLFETIQVVSKKMKLKLLSAEELQNLESRTLFKMMGIGPLGILRFVWLCRKELSTKELPPIFEGMSEVLHAARNRNFTLGIVSSHETSRIYSFLKRENLESLFSFVEGGTSLWSKDKSLWKLSVRFPTLNALYIGDEERDIVSGHRAGYGVISVTWGVKSSNLLKSFGPNYLVENPGNLLELINTI